MTDAQTKLYWREWQACSKARKERGLASTDANRHALHVEALGVDVSMKHLTQRQFDRVLAKFRSYSCPADLNAQMRAEDQEDKRLKAAIQEITELAERADIKGGCDGVSRYFHRWLQDRPLQALDFQTLKVVAGMLHRRIAQLPTAAQTQTAHEAKDDGDPF